jgi:hypothetical protein
MPYYITVNVAPRVSSYGETVSQTGHIWYVLTDSTGQTTSYGFHPDADG